MKTVAVVGAGIAGLTAARRLRRAGLDVTVFDKARGAGGRTSTRRRGGDAFDHGAQYFTCRSDAFGREVEDWCRRGVAAAWTEPILVLKAGEVVEARRASARYVGVPGMSALARDLAEGVCLETGQRIERVEAANGRSKNGRLEGWTLAAEHGATFGVFDAVVAATPAPQAVPLLASAPRLAKAAAAVRMEPCLAVLASFAEPLGVDFGGAFVAESPLAWVARNTSKPGRPDGECWVLHASHEWSRAHLESPGEEVGLSLVRALAHALGRSLPEPASLQSHRWRFARTAKPLAAALSWDAELGLGVCGDWTAGERVEDAFLSGEALAQAMLDERGPGGARTGLEPRPR